MLYRYDSRNFVDGIGRWLHRRRLAGRAFAVVGLFLVIPVHAFLGAVQRVREHGAAEFMLLMRAAFGRWKDINSDRAAKP